MNQDLLRTVNWTAISGIVVLVAMCVGVAIMFTQLMKWNTISFADILRDYSKLILIVVLALVVIGGGLLWASSLATTEFENIAPGSQPLQQQQQQGQQQQNQRGN